MMERKASAAGAELEGWLPLNPLEFRILLVLLSGPSHGYRIVKEIEAREAGATVYPANLYRRIRDLLEKGWVEELPLKAREVTGRRKTELRVTELGRRIAKAEARRLEGLVMDARAARLLERVR